MPKVLIVYDTVTGNTEKMAFAVSEGVKQVDGVEVDIRRVEKASVDDLLNADGIIFGCPTYFGQISGKLKSFIDRSERIHHKLEGKVGAAFTSAAFAGAETTLLSIIEAFLIHGMIIQGRSSDKYYGSTSIGQPTEKDLESCRDLGNRVAQLVLKLKK